MSTETKTFESLKVGEQFYFNGSGSLLTKTGLRSYDAPQWSQYGMAVWDKDTPVVLARKDANARLDP